MRPDANVQAQQGLQRVIEPRTVKMSALVNNSAGSSIQILMSALHIV